MVITTDNQDKGQRLDKFLVNRCPGVHRTAVQTAIKQGEVTVNGKKVLPHYFLKGDEKLNVPAGVLKPPAKKKPTRPPNDQLPTVIAETADYLVVDKPAGWLTHPAPSAPRELTLVDWLSKRYPELKKVGPDETRGGIVHRLDREASGLLLIARANAFYEAIVNQFKDRAVEKEYLVLVHEPLSKLEGIVDFAISRGENGKMTARPKAAAGQVAVTKYAVLKNYDHFGYLSVRIETGRTHQIRVHLRALGHPVVGDKLYRPKRTSAKVANARLFLHAHKLTFTDLAGKRQEYQSPLPADLQKVLEKIKE